MLRLLLALALLSLPGTLAAATWRLAPETTVAVDVTWQGSRVEVRFPALSGEIVFDERRPETAAARITVLAASAETGLAPVNALARSEGYLAADRFPTITFVLDRLVQTSRSTADIFGRITFRGVTRPIAFRATVFRYGPAAEDPARFEAGFTLEGEIDRTAFGSTGGLPQVAAVLPIRIRLLMVSD